MFMYYRNDGTISDLVRERDGNTAVVKDIYGKNLSLKEKHIGLSFKLNARGLWIRFYLRAHLALRYSLYP